MTRISTSVPNEAQDGPSVRATLRKQAFSLGVWVFCLACVCLGNTPEVRKQLCITTQHIREGQSTQPRSLARLFTKDKEGPEALLCQVLALPC